jgi:hypothetical protein
MKITNGFTRFASGSFVDASLQLMDGFVRPENYINLRLVMYWHAKITMAAEEMWFWLDVMLIIDKTFFLYEFWLGK